ncbi:hypothetical protein D6777_01005 [Candidatus Woesearchaeota archaeon]|nr:MAG: hypothetical protein D6777_01005 [Candidatus Woesearchaeota archaeon]
MIEIGEKIKLEGFEDIEPAAVIVMKKMIGSFVRKFYEEHGEFEHFKIAKVNNEIVSELFYNNQKILKKAETSNLFFSLADALEQTKKFINSPDFHIGKKV